MNVVLRFGAAVIILAAGVAIVGFFATMLPPHLAKLLPGLIGGTAILVGVLYIFLARESGITVSQIPTVLSKLQSYGKNGAYALFTFQPSDSGGEISFQFSIEGNSIGLDWYRLHKERGEDAYVRNETDLPQFLAFVRKLGYDTTEKEAKGYRYVRVERGGALSELATKLVRELYGLKPKNRIKLEVEGFEWKT
ncbi:hypothetical protein HRbin33_01091 [bacterium HR33]|nr:hypothetical protein HRbin33_01091 [bacterium HR33]